MPKQSTPNTRREKKRKEEEKKKDTKQKTVKTKTIQKKVGFTQEQTEGGAVTPPQRIGPMRDRALLPGEVKVTTRPSGTIKGGPQDIDITGLTPIQVEQAIAERDIEMAKSHLEQAGAFDEIQPEREISLQPERVTGEGIPVIGPATAALSASWAHWFKNIPFLKKFVGEGAETGESAFPILDDFTAREIALNEIRRNNYDKGIKASNAFGTLVEAVPIAGSLVGKYAGGLVDDPSNKVETLMAEVRSERERAATSTEKVNSGLITPIDGLDISETMQDNMARLEGKIKLLTSTSPELRSNPEEVDKNEEEITRARERIDQYHDASSKAYARQLVQGFISNPTNEQIYVELGL